MMASPRGGGSSVEGMHQIIEPCSGWRGGGASEIVGELRAAKACAYLCTLTDARSDLPLLWLPSTASNIQAKSRTHI